jgi:multicomponent Na+:H+ antiporter subunit F
MSVLLVGSAIFILMMVAMGLARILWGPANADRLMAAQLVSSGGVAALLLLSVAENMPAIIDVALMLAILAVFATVGFVNWAGEVEETNRSGDDA